MLALTGLCSALPSMTVAESCKRVLRADAARCTLVRQQSSWGALVMRTIPDIDFMIVATAHTTAFDSSRTQSGFRLSSRRVSTTRRFRSLSARVHGLLSIKQD